jgi:hypothetical protein
MIRWHQQIVLPLTVEQVLMVLGKAWAGTAPLIPVAASGIS